MSAKPGFGHLDGSTAGGAIVMRAAGGGPGQPWQIVEDKESKRTQGKTEQEPENPRAAAEGGDDQNSHRREEPDNSDIIKCSHIKNQVTGETSQRHLE